MESSLHFYDKQIIFIPHRESIYTDKNMTPNLHEEDGNDIILNLQSLNACI